MPFKNKEDLLRNSKKYYQEHRDERIKYEYESRAIVIMTGARWSKDYMDANPDKVGKMVEDFLALRKRQKAERRKRSQERRRAYLKNYAKINADRKAEYVAKYKQEHKEEIRKYHAERYVTHRDEIRKWHAKHRVANREKLNKQSAEIYRKNPEYEKRRRAEYYQRNRQRLLDKQAKDRKERPEIYKQRRAAKYAKDPEAARLHGDLRRARKSNALIGDTKAIYHWNKAWRKLKRVTCHYCQGVFPPSKCEQDHVIPLAAGGMHSTSNLCVSCKKCNRLKHAKPLDKWNKTLAQPVLL